MTELENKLWDFPRERTTSNQNNNPRREIEDQIKDGKINVSHYFCLLYFILTNYNLFNFLFWSSILVCQARQTLSS